MNGKRARRAAMVLVACAAGCGVNTNPELPTWETDFEVPLGTKTVFLSEWVDESDDLYENEAGLVAFHLEGAVDRAEVGDRLTVDPIEREFHRAIGAFRLDEPAERQTEIRFVDLWPPAPDFEGQSAPVPPFQFESVESPVPPLETILSMTLEAGTLTVALTNHLPVAVDDVRLTLVEEASAREVVGVDFPLVPAGGTGSSAVDLAGTTVPSSLLVRASGGSPGSGGTLVGVDPNAAVVFDVALTGLRASEATAELPATSIEVEESAEVPGDLKVSEAEIARGAFRLRVANDLPVTVAGAVEVRELLDPSAAPVRVNLEVPAGSSAETTVPLAGCRLAMDPPAPGETQRVHFGGSFGTRETDGVVSLTSGDGLAVEALVDTLSFVRVTGIPEEMEFQVAPTSCSIDIPDELEGVRLAEATLHLHLRSSIDVPMTLALAVRGESAKQSVVVLPVSVVFPGGGKAVAGQETDVVLDATNSGLCDFLDNLPVALTVGGEGRVGDGETEGSIARTDWIEGEYEIDVPFAMAFEEQDVESDLTEIDILPEGGADDGGDDAVDGDRTRQVRSARLWLTFVNHTPVGAVVTARFATDSTRVFTDPDLELEPLEIAAGGCDAGGVVTQASTFSNAWELEEADLDLFRNAGNAPKTVYFGAHLELQSTGGQVVKVRASDYIEVRGRMLFRARVEPSEID